MWPLVEDLFNYSSAATTDGKAINKQRNNKQCTEEEVEVVVESGGEGIICVFGRGVRIIGIANVTISCIYLFDF